MKKLKYILFLFLMFFSLNDVFAFDTSLKVYDYAQVLTPDEEQELKQKIDLFIANHNMDMAIVTVKYHDKDSTMAYADDFYDYNGFGIGPSYDGVIFVVDFTFGYTDIWMSTTGSAINVYTDYKIDLILDDVSAEYRTDSGYFEMLNTFVESTSDYYSLDEYSEVKNELKIAAIRNIIILSLVIPTVIIVILVFKNRMVKKATAAAIYLNKDSVVINKRSDRFITTHTTSVRINDSSSSSGGGSSTHTSSSGRSHGGGGRRL